MLLSELTRSIDYCSPLAVALRLMADEDGAELVIEPEYGCLDDRSQCIDRGAIIVLADHACGLLLRRRFDPSPMATLNLRVDWISAPEPGKTVLAHSRMIAHNGMTALVAVNIGHPGSNILIAKAISQVILGVAPGGTTTPFRPMAVPAIRRDTTHTRFANFTELLDIQRTEDGFRLPLAPHLFGNATVSALHGGLIGAALYRATAMALQEFDGTGSWCPLGVWIEYLRPVTLGGQDLGLKPSIRRLGRTVVSVECTAHGGPGVQLVARAGVKFVVPDAGGTGS